ncbi:Aste57867_16864 [Aphanomyces stellatus]|uniref:Aste57867_16864 protein n=1 Tax=Aphanomyces stellatus TaxID=120398 RepID=A0A485L9K7_9STRA|nr:hypothetical protein As57867_016806 [Aphanomyces stellatus]VFT93628.1 Aste57867_16864 [Aphanomyces stellatus]
MFQALSRSPSLRIQAFLHWLSEVVSPEASLATQFTPADRAVLGAMAIADGDLLAEKERMQDVDDDEAALLAEIAQLEQQLVKESRKDRVLTTHLAAAEADLARAVPRSGQSTTSSSRLEAVDTILDQLAEGSNAFALAALCPNACVSLSVQEDKLLDEMQAQLMPHFRRSNSPLKKTLETILESPHESREVSWLHARLAGTSQRRDSLDDDEDDDEDDDSQWTQELSLWKDEFADVEAKWLHAKLALTEAMVLRATTPPPTTSLAQTSACHEELERLLDDDLPPLLDAVADAYVTSMVIGDYPRKFDQQAHHMAQLDEALLVLEHQAARLQLMWMRLEAEVDAMATLRDLVYGLLQDMQRQLQDVMARLAASPSPPDKPKRTDATETDEHVRQLEAMRAQLRAEWAMLGQAQARAVADLKHVMDEAPTVAPQVQQISRLKDVVETELAKAIESVRTKENQKDLVYG